MVMIFTSGEWAFRKNAYNAVVFPEPVGPVVTMSPLGRFTSSNMSV